MHLASPSPERLEVSCEAVRARSVALGHRGLCRKRTLGAFSIDTVAGAAGPRQEDARIALVSGNGGIFSVSRDANGKDLSVEDLIAILPMLQLRTANHFGIAQQR